MEKWGDHQKMKFSINNSVEAVILSKEKYQGLLKMYVPFGGVPVSPNIPENVSK